MVKLIIDFKCSIRTLNRRKINENCFKSIVRKVDTAQDELVLTYDSDCASFILVSWKALTLRSVSCFADANSQQGCIVKSYNRPRDRPYIKRCSANGGRHSHVAFLIDSFVLCPGGDISVTRVLDWLAISYRSLFLMFSCAIPRWVLLSQRCTTRARSSSVRSTHLLDEPSGLWDSCHQNTCVGRWIQKQN